MADKPKKDDRWKEQLARVRRWHLKAQKINRDKTSISDDELDLLFAFFLNCWHLYDWLKNSNALSTEALDNFFRKNETMKLCYDICIGAKHLNIDYPKGGFNRLHIAREYMGKDADTGKTQLILFESGIQDMVGLANNCMMLIESFLREHKLE